MTDSTEFYDEHRRGINIDRWRSLIIWADPATGAETVETVGWAAVQASEAMATVAAYLPPQWLPTEDGKAIARAEVRLGRFTELVNGSGMTDLQWTDEGPTHIGEVSEADGVTFGPVELPAEQPTLFADNLTLFGVKS